MLSSALGPFHRSFQLEGEGGDRVLLGIDGRLGAEASSDIWRHDSQLVGRETQIGGQVCTDRVWGLSGCPQRQASVDVVPHGEHRPPFQRGQRATMLVHLDRHHPVREGEGTVDVAEAGGESAHQVGL